MANKIEIYQNNNKTISCVVSGLDVTGYTPYFTAKENTTSTSVISSTGTISDASTLLFNLSSTDTSVAAANYVYDITVEVDTSIYTVVKDMLIVLDGCRY